MLRPFIRYHIARARAGLLTNTIRNCHVVGMHSIMLHEEPGNRIRMFYADYNHPLARNCYANLAAVPMTLAAHAHHCDVTLIKVFGEVYNIKVKPVPDVAGDFVRCEYRSAITTGRGSMQATEERFKFVYNNMEIISPNGVEMSAKDVHTVSVPLGKEAAWLVIEGKEDPTYKSECWTNNPVFDTTDLYIKEPGLAEQLFQMCLANTAHLIFQR